MYREVRIICLALASLSAAAGRTWRSRNQITETTGERRTQVPATSRRRSRQAAEAAAKALSPRSRPPRRFGGRRSVRTTSSFFALRVCRNYDVLGVSGTIFRRMRFFGLASESGWRSISAGYAASMHLRLKQPSVRFHRPLPMHGSVRGYLRLKKVWAIMRAVHNELATRS